MNFDWMCVFRAADNFSWLWLYPLLFLEHPLLAFQERPFSRLKGFDDVLTICFKFS
jgi:hypothetical protein